MGERKQHPHKTRKELRNIRVMNMPSKIKGKGQFAAMKQQKSLWSNQISPKSK